MTDPAPPRFSRGWQAGSALFPGSMSPLRTDRLLLRPLSPDDLGDLHELFRRPELMRHVTGAARTPAQTERSLRGYLEDHARHGFGLCLAIHARDGAVLGVCGIEPEQDLRGVQGNLFFLFVQSAWNLGFATEAARALLRFAFLDLMLPRVVAAALHENRASIRIFEKLGMRRSAATVRGVEYEIFAPPPPASKEAAAAPMTLTAGR